jgi:hypothetical protein
MAFYVIYFSVLLFVTIFTTLTIGLSILRHAVQILIHQILGRCPN